jgi:DNA-binding LacI/PurR family transcriptional regulator
VVNTTGTKQKRPQRTRRKILHVTMQDVADLSGVAFAKVSLYFRKLHLVRAQTQAKIVTAAAQLSYVPNVLAGGLAAAWSRLVSLIVPTFCHGFLQKTFPRQKLSTEPKVTASYTTSIFTGDYQPIHHHKHKDFGR